MDSAEPAEKLAALEAELAAKSFRIAELEARVSLLEAENAHLREAMAKVEAAGRTGEENPLFGRLEEACSGNRQTAAGKLGGDAACNVIVLSDGEEGGAIDAEKGASPGEGVDAVRNPRKCAVRAVTGDSEDVEGGSESNKGNAGCDSNLDLEDDDVSVTARGKKRAAARVVTSDSEEDDADGGELGSSDDDGQEEGVVASSRKRALRGVSYSESEDEDDNIPICQVLKKMRKGRVSDDESGEAKGSSTPATRRSARLVKNQSKGGRAARRVLNFVDPKECEGSEDDMEEDDDMDDFINDEDSSENASDSAEESLAEPEVPDASSLNEESSPPPEPDESDGEINYEKVMARIGRKREAGDWKFEAEMLRAFDEHPELCLKAVCALYQRQTEEEQQEKATIVDNKEGFSQIDALRASRIAEFLLDGDLYGPPKKTVRDLEGFDRYALQFCRKVASKYSKQLFAIYQNKEDPYFHP